VWPPDLPGEGVGVGAMVGTGVGADLAVVIVAAPSTDGAVLAAAVDVVRRGRDEGEGDGEVE